ncbi:hypothetical protein [Zobellia laminariae]|uniref:hypothetical protein n=1 Tax=Zobellia laminariae TaxID=248906 RepID=UPI0026F41048|nr:hypothetical protein [Zobellia laminariae]WKX76944.1 hypothetical protein Q5W13_01910 [Zobellia laminariae]
MFENIYSNSNWKTIDINYPSIDLILKKIPTSPGIYTISTNTATEILSSFEEREDPMHYNLSKKVKASSYLPARFRIMQHDDFPYVIYSGHSYRLRQRAREHFKGSKGTGCLAVFNLENLRGYDWSFRYLETSFMLEDYKEDSILFRTVLEQRLRVEMGWPLLCSQ